jgi:DNA-binding PadR family transcriptional regulator
MSLRYAVLGLLAQHPSTGYELTQRFDRSLNNAWHASHSQIYPELGKLHEAGLIEVVGEGARNSRTYDITAQGRDELRHWLVDVEPNRAQRNEGAVRFFLTLVLDPEDRIKAFERDLDFVHRQVAYLREMDEKVAKAPPPQPMRPTIDLGLRLNEVFEAWLNEQIEAARR